MNNFGQIITLRGRYIHGEVTIDDVNVVAGNYEVLVTFLQPISDDYEFSPKIGKDADMISLLTQTEMKVLDLIASGKTNNQISEEMELNSGTVRNYVSSILKKFGAQNRTQLVAFQKKINR